MTTATATDAPVYVWDDLPLEAHGNPVRWLAVKLKEHDGVWVRGMPHHTYLSVPAMSASGMERFRRSPLHYARTPAKPPTPAMIQGTAFHMALLEPDLFKDRYVSVGQCEGRKGDGDRCQYSGKVVRQGKAYCGRHDPENGAPMPPEITVLPGEILARVKGMAEAVLSHPEAGLFFQGIGWSEVSGFWRDPATRVACKLRLDRDPKRASVHCDAKGTDDARPHAFRRRAAQLGYHRKAAWYRRGMALLGRPADASVLLATEFGVKYPKGEWEPGRPTGPHGVRVYTLVEEQLEALYPLIDHNLELYAECVRSDEWPGYPTGMDELWMPDWAMEYETTAIEEDDDGDGMPF